MSWRPRSCRLDPQRLVRVHDAFGSDVVPDVQRMTASSSTGVTGADSVDRCRSRTLPSHGVSRLRGHYSATCSRARPTSHPQTSADPRRYISRGRGRHPLDVGHHVDPKGVVHTHQSLRVEGDTIAAAHDMRPGEALLLRCRSPRRRSHVRPAAPRTSAITAVLMDTWEPAARSSAATRTHRGNDLDAGVHAHDDRSSVVRHHRRSRMRLFSLGGRSRAAMVREVRSVRLLVQTHVWLHRVPDAHDGRLGDDSNATRRPTAAHWRRRVAYRRSADAPRRAARQSGRGPRARSEMSPDTSTPLDRVPSSTAAGSHRRPGVYDGTYLTIVDRLKDVIIRAARTSRRSRSSRCWSPTRRRRRGMRRDARRDHGEKVCAYVVPRDGATPQLDDLRAICSPPASRVQAAGATRAA